MSRTLLATICLSTAMMGGEYAAATEAGGHIPTGLHPQLRIGQPEMSAVGGRAGGPDWIAQLATAEPVAFGPHAVRLGGSRISFHGSRDAGLVPYGAAAALDVGVVEPGHAGFRSRKTGQPGTAVTASLVTAVGMQSDSVSAAAFSDLTYSRIPAGDGLGYLPHGGHAEALTGSIGVQSTAHFDTPMGAMAPQFQLSLDHDFDIGEGFGDPFSGLDRRNIYIEERDATEFDLDNAISLRMKGIVPGWFHYETRIRVRLEGIREVSGRIRFKW